LTAGTVTGAAVFADSAVITKADFASTAKFAGTATLGDVSFGDDVTITDAKALTLTSAKTLTLAKDKSIKIDDTTAPIAVLTASAESVLTPGGATTLTPASTDKKLTVGGAALKLTSGALAVPAGVTLKADSVALTIGSGASLALTGATGTGGAKIEGKIVAAKTELSGIWQAVGEGAVAITAASDVSVIAASATTVLTASTGGTITQGIGANNNLMIAANTTIDLKGTLAATDTVVGTIKLSESTTADAGGKLTLSAATSVIKVGGDTDGTALGTTGGAFVLVAAAATGKITVSSFTDVQVLPGTGNNATGKVNTIKGTSTPGTLQAFGSTGGTGTVDIKAGTATA
jgi:hypothetical protein